MQNDIKISATVCTLNEERNIRDCLRSIKENNPFEIIVVDASSSDRTVEIAGEFTDKVYVVPKKGLAFQRQYAVERAEGDYIAMIDADHRLSAGMLKLLVSEMNANGYDGIQAQIRSASNTTYWEWAMEENFNFSHNVPGPRIVIGAPGIYRAGVLKTVKYDPFFTAASDDTDLCYRMVEAGYKLGVGTAQVLQCHRSSFCDVVKKWLWYGKGDAQFFWRHPRRRLSIFLHPIKNYMVLRSLKSISKGKLHLVPFFLLCGAMRHIGFLTSYFSMCCQYLRRGTIEDVNIYKT